MCYRQYTIDASLQIIVPIIKSKPRADFNTKLTRKSIIT